MAITKKIQQVGKMTTLGIEKCLGFMALQQRNFEVSIHNPIKLTDSLKVTPEHAP